MKTAIVWLGGILVGILISVPARRAVVHYSEYSLPAPWTGPKMRVWCDGEEGVFDPATQRWGAVLAD